MQQLKQQVRAPARAVLFFLRSHVTRAHGAAVIFSARAEPNASQRGFCQRAVVLGKLEVRFRFERAIVRAEPQVFRRQMRIHHFVGIKLVVRVPGALEFSERLHQLRTEHFWKQRRSRLPIAVFAGKRASIRNHQVRRALDELAVLANARFAFEVERDAHVHAAVTEMSVERSPILVFIQQPANIAQVAAQFFGRHCRIVPAFPFRRRSRSKRCRARASFADLPHGYRFNHRIQAHAGWCADIFQALHQH